MSIEQHSIRKDLRIALRRSESKLRFAHERNESYGERVSGEESEWVAA
jgi:hypothetical protein